jgi:hypothetical protein
VLPNSGPGRNKAPFLKGECCRAHFPAASHGRLGTEPRWDGIGHSNTPRSDLAACLRHVPAPHAGWGLLNVGAEVGVDGRRQAHDNLWHRAQVAFHRSTEPSVPLLLPPPLPALRRRHPDRQSSPIPLLFAPSRFCWTSRNGRRRASGSGGCDGASLTHPWVQSRSRRQQVLPSPQPSSLGNVFQEMAVWRTSRIQVRTWLLPVGSRTGWGNRRGSAGDNCGSTKGHLRSSRIGLAMAYRLVLPERNNNAELGKLHPVRRSSFRAKVHVRPILTGPSISATGSLEPNDRHVPFRDKHSWPLVKPL